ncbi:DUF1566 domain-containing protein [Mariniflexile litorale]|uniref:DUF1566 domain-containing protein n=1 Tax=Mariniflexile litorale TaxID=3045158 RepID=A0AAU7EDD8_9FLAO|nr:DUF1566 domain-containing protein [Mariniflexile sp. KMM 9835]MDQ8212931.1 DUF1566 domain-containing protein [Mariniflexile sp. KMM 9835]
MKNIFKIILFLTSILTLSSCSKNDADNSQAIEIGDFYEGGIVFYLDDTGEHGLVCATKDLIQPMRWGYNDVLLNNTQQTIGSGLANTQAIAAAYPDIETAAKLCLNFEYNEYDDWYLPSLDELNLIYINKNKINPTAIANDGEAFQALDDDRSNYWSSSEGGEMNAWLIQFDTGVTKTYYKTYIQHMRAIRAF